MLNGGHIYLEGIMSSVIKSNWGRESSAQIIMTQTLTMIYNELIELMGGLITEGNENE